MFTQNRSTERKNKHKFHKFHSALRQTLILTFSFFALLSPFSASADIPATIGYQGILKNSSGTVLSGTYSFTFRIYASSTGGAALWSEVQPSVTLTGGTFAVRLGSVTAFPSSLDFNQPLFVSTEVNGDGEMSPRITINSVPYAYTAGGITALPSAPVSATGGRMYYDTTTGGLSYYDSLSSSWVLLGSSTGTLQTVTNAGNVTTNAIQFAGGTSTGNFTVSSSLTVSGDSSLQEFTFSDSTGTTLLVTNGTATNFSSGNVTLTGGTLNGVSIGLTSPSTAIFTNVTSTSATTTNLYATNATVQNLTITGTSPSNLSNLIWTNATGTNTTSTNLYAQSLTGSVANITTLTAPTLNATDLTFANGTSTSWFGFATASGTNVYSSNIFASSIQVNGSSVCLANGTNCPAGSNSSLAIVTANGATTTATIQMYGGFISSSSTVTSTLTVLGDTSLQNATMSNVTATTVTTTNFFATNATATNLVVSSLTITGATPAAFNGISWINATGTNTTSTNLYAQSLTGSTANITSLTAPTLTFTNGTSSGYFGFNTASGTSIFASAIAVNGFSVCLQNGTNCPSSVSADFQTVTNGGNTTTNAIQFAGGTSTNNFLPSTDATLSLGSSANRWNANLGSVTATAVTTTNLYAAVANLVSLVATNGTFSGLTWTDATGTNTTSTNLYATNGGILNASTTNLTATNATTTNLAVTNLTVTGAAPSNFTNLTWTNATGTNTTTTNLYVTNGQIANGTITNGTITNLTFTNGTSTGWFGFNTASGTTVNALSGTINSLTAPTLVSTEAVFTNVTSTSVTSTNLYATNAVFSNLTITGTTPASFTNLTWTNATGTNTTSTNLYAQSLTGSVANITTLTAPTLTFTNGTSSGYFGFNTASGTSIFASSIQVNGSSVCLANGTNCPVAAADYDSLATVTANGATTTATLQLYGGFIGASSTVTSTFTVLGNTSLQDLTFVNGTATSVTTTNLFTTNGQMTNGTITNGTISNLTSVNSTSTGWFGFATASGTTVNALSGTINSLTASTLISTNALFTNVTSTSVTSTNLYATNAVFSSLTITGAVPASFENIIWTNATGTNTTTTNLAVTGSLSFPNDSITDAMVTSTLTVSELGNVSATSINSGTLGNAGVTLNLSGFGNVTGTLAASKVLFNKTSSSEVMTDQRLLNIWMSNSVLNGGDISVIASGTMQIGAGRGFIRNAATDPEADIILYSWATSSFSVPFFQWTYAYIYNDGGNVSVVATTTSQDDNNLYLRIGKFYNFGVSGIVTLHDERIYATELRKRLFTFLEEAAGHTVTDGCVISPTGTRNLTISSCTAWYGTTESTISLFDSSSDSMYSVYRNGTGGFIRSVVTQWDNLYYDDGTGVLAALGLGEYGVHWVYRHEAPENYTDIVYGTQSYTSLAEALAATPPTTLPEAFLDGEHAFLIGAIVFEQGGSSITSIRDLRPFLVDRTGGGGGGGGSSNHNDLAGLQGGTAGQYYHLTATGFSAAGALTFSTAGGANLTLAPTDVGNTKAIVTNAGAGIADFDIVEGSLLIASTTRITNAGYGYLTGLDISGGLNVTGLSALSALTFDSATATAVTTTNLYAGMGRFDRLTATTSTITDLFWSNATGTNGFVSSLQFLSASGSELILSNATFTNLTTLQRTHIEDLDFMNATGVNLVTTGVVSSSELHTGNVTMLNATATNMFVDQGLRVGIGNFPVIANSVAQFGAVTDTYLQVNLQNRSTGTNASGDFVVTADNGDDFSYYIDMGINGSGYNVPSFSIVGPDDGYLYVHGGNLAIGTASASTSVVFHAGGTTAADEVMRLTSDHFVGIGTDAPSTTLHVVGDAIVSGLLTVNDLLWTNATGTNTTSTYLSVLTAAQLPANTFINSKAVCLLDGTNCPSGTTPNFQTVTNTGNTTTNAIQFAGGTSTRAFTFQNNLTVTGTTALQDLSFVNATGQYIDFTTSTAMPGTSEGRLFYDNTQKALAFYSGTSTTPIEVGRQSFIHVRNLTGSAISKGQALRVTGEDGSGIPTVALAKADSATTVSVAGIANENIPNGDTGNIIVNGTVANFDTSVFSAGDVVYLSAATSGALTNVRPPTPNITMQIGVVTKSDVASGRLLVNFITPKFGAIATGGVTFGDTNNFITEDSANFYWDNTLNRLGIGTSTPQAPLHVVGNILADGMLWTSATGTSLTITGTAPSSFANLTWTNATGTNTTSTNLSVLTSAYLPTNTFINGVAVCLDDGTNCPTSASADFQTVTNNGNTTTRDLQFNGGTSTGNFVFYGNITVNSSTSMQQATIVNATGTNVTTTNFAVLGNISTDLLPTLDATLSLGSAALRWNGVFTNVTSTSATTTNFFATNAQLTNGTITSGTVSNLSFTNGTSTSWFGFSTASGTTINASTGAFANLASQNVTLTGGTMNGVVIGNTSPAAAVFTNVTSTSATTTNFFATNATITNLSVTGAAPSSFTNLLWTNATGTNTTSTYLAVLTAARLPATTLINNTQVCLLDGTNCPSSTSANFQTVTNAGNTTTRDIQFNGGTSTGNFVFYGNVTVNSSTSMQQVTMVNVTGTNVTTTNLAVSGAISTNLLPTRDAALSLGSSALRWNGVFSDVTSTNVTTTNIFATRGSMTNLNVTSGTFDGLTWTSATGTNTTSTYLNATWASFTNLLATNATTTNLYASYGSFAQLLSTSSTLTSFTYQNSVGMNATTTNFYASNITGGSVTTLNNLFVTGTMSVGGVTLFDGNTRYTSNLYLAPAASTSTTPWKSSNISATGIESIRSLQAFNGYLYAGRGDSVGDGDVMMCTPTTAGNASYCDNAADWTTSTNSNTASRVDSMTVYNNRLYVGEGSGAALGIVRFCNPSTTGSALTCDSGDWTTSTATGLNDVRALLVYNGYLYAAADSGAGSSATIYACDPTRGGDTNDCDNAADWTSSTITAGVYEQLPAFAVYMNRLYAFVGNSNGDDDFIICNPGGGGRPDMCDNNADWTRTINNGAGYTTVESAAVYNGSLYVGLGSAAATGDLVRCVPSPGGDASICDSALDVNSMTPVVDNAGTITRIPAMIQYRGSLFFGQEGATGDGAIKELITSYVSTTQSGAGFEATYAFAEYNGVLYAGRGNAAGNGQVWYYVKGRTVSNALNFEVGTATGSVWLSDESYSFQGAGTNPSATFGVFKFSHGIVTEAGAYDLAEMYPVAEMGLESGDVVAMSPVAGGAVERSHGAYDSRAFGVVSTKPGFLLSSSQTGDSVPVALAGRVPVKFSTENGSIQVGDALTAASTTGYAMKATQTGVMIGRALQAFGSVDASSTEMTTTGTIMMVVQTGYFLPTDGAVGIGSLDSTSSSSSSVLQDAGTTPEALLPSGSQIAQGFGVETLVARDATFTGNVTVLGPVSLRGPIILGSSNAGTVDIAARTDRVNVQFPMPYVMTPHVFISFQVQDKSEGLGYDPALWDGQYFLTDVTTTGFGVRFPHGGYCPTLDPCPIGVNMDWFAVGFESPEQTSSTALTTTQDAAPVVEATTSTTEETTIPSADTTTAPADTTTPPTETTPPADTVTPPADTTTTLTETTTPSADTTTAPADTTTPPTETTPPADATPTS